MSAPSRPQVNIALMLRDNLPAAVRELDTQIKATEQRLEDLRRERTTLTQVAIAAGIHMVAASSPDETKPADAAPENTEPRQVAA